MSAGDVHVVGADGWPLCGSNGPLRGYSATSQSCRDCDAMERSSGWKGTALPYNPRTDVHAYPHALLRKRPARLLP